MHILELGQPTRESFLQKQFKSENPIWYARIPEELKLVSGNFDEFASKLAGLFALGAAEYLDLIEGARAYYMNNSESAPADEYLRKAIGIALEKGGGPSGASTVASKIESNTAKA